MIEQDSALAARRKGERICPQCGALFVCGMAASQEKCWCAELLPVLPLPAAGRGGCYCPACLRATIERQGRIRSETAP